MMRAICFGFVVWCLLMSATIQAQTMTESQARAYIDAIAIDSPYRIPRSMRAGKIRYHFRLGDVAEAQRLSWPQTGEQHVVLKDNGLWLDVCKTCGREAPPSEETLARYTQPSDGVQSDDKDIRRFARAVLGSSVKHTMTRMAHAVGQHMDQGIRYNQYLSAKEAFAQRQGDCTEYALLLAAAGRARGIPTRVVAGVVYGSRFVNKPQAFGPHMWVQSWDGKRWVSFDAALGRFDATHIAMYVGDGDEASLRGLMDQIKTASLVDAVYIEPAD